MVVADFAREQIHLFRSPLLGRPLFYFLSRACFVAASEVSGVLRHAAVGDDLSDAWLAHFFNFRTPSNAMTPFRSVSELLPGELLTVTRDADHVVRHPPDIGRQRIRFSDEREYQGRFDELVSSAVARNVRGRKEIGIMLSGGLDSVPVAYWMRQHRDPDNHLTAYSWSLSEFPEADESALIAQSADTVGIPLHLIAGDDLWPLYRTEKVPLCPDTPQQNAFRPLKEAVYRMASADGCRFIFNGNYGDNLYPEYHHVLADSLYDGRLRRFTRELRALAGIEGLPGLYRHRAVRQIVKKALGWRSRPLGSNSFLTSYAIGMLDLEQHWPLEAQDHPRPDQYRALLGVAIARGISGECYFADLYGLELVEPYVDWDLVNFVLSVPSYVFWRSGETKVPMRQVMRGRIPEAVRVRPRGGLLDSFFFFGIDKRIDWIKQRLFSGETDWPRFVDSRQVREILEAGQPSEADSMLIFQCIAYEMWLDQYFR